MRLHRFEADSMAAALARVKRELGDQAVIVHTRCFQRGGLFGWGGRRCVEITATLEPRVLERVQRRAADASASQTAPQRVAKQEQPLNDVPQVILPLSRRDCAKSDSQIFPPPFQVGMHQMELRPGGSRHGGLTNDSPPSKGGPRGVPIPQSPPLSSPDTRTPDSAPPLPNAADFMRELSAVRDLVKEVLRERRDRAPADEMPQDLSTLYTRLIGQQVAESLARELLEDLLASVPKGPDGVAPPEALEAALRERIVSLLPPAEPFDWPADGAPKVVALVGPTGVGKTTTIAKLAAHFKLRESRRVGLITLDTFRIAAVEQLRVYANILDVPLVVAPSPADVPAAMTRLRDAGCELVLIDTAGRSQRDTRRIDELRQFLDAAGPLETHLVLAGNAAESAAWETVRHFSPLRPQRVIFTKLDEAVGLGLILNILTNVGLRVSYVTTGQSVPNDLEVGHAARIADMILGTRREALDRGFN